MDIIIGKTAGFCFGVANAVNKTSKLLDEHKSMYCLGELVHNKEVTKELEGKGLKIIDDIKKADKNVIIRAHGTKKHIYDKANEMGLQTIDLTCPKVLKIHKIVEEYASSGYYIFLIGSRNHPETIGTISYCGNSAYIIENEEHIDIALKNLYESKIKKLLIIAQTTYSLEKFNNIISLIENKLKNQDIKLEIKRTICDATRLRQEETEKISSIVDMMIIIGGRHSSNTNKLYEISKKKCDNSILIETSEELDLEDIKKYNKIRNYGRRFYTTKKYRNGS